jgi:hypothetical protein
MPCAMHAGQVKRPLQPPDDKALANGLEEKSVLGCWFNVANVYMNLRICCFEMIISPFFFKIHGGCTHLLHAICYMLHAISHACLRTHGCMERNS